MKKIFLLFIISTIIFSCEDVIEVELENSKSRLVIEASINLLEDGTTKSIIKLTETAPFFDNVVPSIDDAMVTITADNGATFNFEHTENGIYTSALIPEFGVNYTLTINYNGETYIATESLNSVPPIGEITQNNQGGFTGEDIELQIEFTDPGGVDNYYYFEGLSEKGNDRDAFNDEFFDGNSIQGFYFVDDLEAGDIITFNLFGVDEGFYNFMFALLQQSSSQGGGPFETQPATIKGNIINETNPDNYPLGYFRISELSTLEYTVE